MTKDQLGKPEVVWLQDLAQIYNPRPISIQVSRYFFHVLYMYIFYLANGNFSWVAAFKAVQSIVRFDQKSK